ncbi:hypothetical protein [Weissella confusa]|uniref:hypothetical protein n=1 Tax=Weissella confusa TaxID=1583 RepID=UPI0018F2585C|nr:hypothetical protein [Weissella confusa]MBJ7692439.1 hypothetical protein [Weissella confusa]
MKIKWTIITLLSLTAIAAASYWGVDVFNDNKTYQRNMQSAREAVAAHEWSDAAVYYKAARKVHVSIENRTALEQLNYLERADKEIQADNWPSALNLYSRVLETNDGVDLLNKAAKSGETYVNALKTADEKSDKVSTLKKALAKKTSELAQVQSVASDSVKAAQDSANNAISAANSSVAKMADSQSEKSDTKTSTVVDKNKKDDKHESSKNSEG